MKPEPEMDKQASNFNPALNPKKARETLFSHLKFSLRVCREKASKKKALNKNRQKWIRLLVFTVEAYAKLLDSVQLQELEERLEALE